MHTHNRYVTQYSEPLGDGYTNPSRRAQVGDYAVIPHLYGYGVTLCLVKAVDDLGWVTQVFEGERVVPVDHRERAWVIIYREDMRAGALSFVGQTFRDYTDVARHLRPFKRSPVAPPTARTPAT